MEDFAVRKIKGTALPLRGDAIDTDRIYPARFLRVVTFEGTEKFLFADDRRTNLVHPFNQKQFENARILLVETSFGGGSSREHAPQALKRRGFQAIVGVSFGEIFFYNSVAIGLPCVRVNEQEAKFLLEAVENEPSVEIEIDLENLTLKIGDETIAIALDENARQQFLNGAWNSLSALLDADNLIEKTAERLPYLGF